MTKNRLFKQGLGFAISAGCLWAIAGRIHLDEVEHVLAGLHWRYLIFGVVSLVFGYCMRILRWSILLRASGARVATIACAAPFLVSIMLNNILPLRAGDIVRAFVFPAAINVRRTTATASLVLERLIDLLSLLLCLGIGLVLSPKSDLPVWVKNTASSLSIVSGMAIAVIVLFNRPIIRLLAGLARHARRALHGRIAAALELILELFSSLGTMSRPSLLPILGLCSLFVWLGEAGLFLALLAGFHLNATIPAALIAVAMTTLSTLVPSAPGYVGTFHMAAFAAATFLGASPAQATSFAVMTHLTVWVSTTAAGAIAAVTTPRLFSWARSA